MTSKPDDRGRNFDFDDRSRQLLQIQRWGPSCELILILTLVKYIRKFFHSLFILFAIKHSLPVVLFVSLIDILRWKASWFAIAISLLCLYGTINQKSDIWTSTEQDTLKKTCASIHVVSVKNGFHFAACVVTWIFTKVGFVTNRLYLNCTVKLTIVCSVVSWSTRNMYFTSF